MATTYTTQAAKINDLANTYAPLKPNELHGRVRVAFFQETCVGSEAIGDIIRLTKLPAGSRVVDFKFCCEDIGAATATLGIGDADDSDRLVSAIAVASAVAFGAASTILRTPTTETPDIGFGYVYDAETWITATVQTAALDAASNFWGAIFYVVD